MEETIQYEEKQPRILLARYDPAMLTVSEDPFVFVPTPEGIAAEWSEQDPTKHFFFVELSTNPSMPLYDPEEYAEMQNAPIEEDEVDAQA